MQYDNQSEETPNAARAGGRGFYVAEVERFGSEAVIGQCLGGETPRPHAGCDIV